ncbi:hypothetical protein BJ138DRAFT_715416 [Hygrophoropsis aurantiaca]|uniref:Uncharacterized protein n=1 Tax=Hygrophoropsis aurantiaca TaxID=72124 RepID=A0ACB7ZY07_9AGAM|nr:hypothetical protein BJ138DRAFT_715416 [Hygrophoropsis aurantiaca]
MENHTEQHDTSIRTAIEIIETEVLGLEKQQSDLLAQLHLLQDTIARKRLLAKNLKNSLVPVNRLPNEILLACFGQAVQDWVDKYDGADAQAVMMLAFDGWYEGCEEDPDFKLSCTPIFAISHVSHRWRQLAISAPSLWTNLVITPKFERHLGVFQDFLHRANGMPIAANFRFFPQQTTPSAAGVLLMEAIMPLIQAQQINALTFLASGSVLQHLLSRVVERTVISPQSPPSIALDHLTALSIFSLEYPKGLTSSHLRQVLSAAPQLKTLELQYSWLLGTTERTDPDKTAIALPMLENLTIIQSNLPVCELLGSLSAPDVFQLKLLMWDNEDFTTSCLFINDNNNVDSGLEVPRFPKVHSLTLSSAFDDDQLGANMIRAFPRVTHLTLGNPGLFYEIDEAASLAIPIFQCLQHLTFDFTFRDAEDAVRHMDKRCCWNFDWLRKSKNQADRPLLISLLDRSTKSMQDANKYLFRYYKELQQYGEFDAGSSRLDEFMRWQADGEPEIHG